MGIPVTVKLAREDRARLDELIKAIKSFNNKELKISWQDKFGVSGTQTGRIKSK